MADSFAQILIHLTFHVKTDAPTILEEHLPRVFEYIGGEVRGLGGIPYVIGGRPDHIHILTTLPKTQTLSDFIMYIKKGCSKWIKGVDARYARFVWQDGYGAFSVSYANKDKVVNYIANQQEHHRHKTLREEMKEFLEKNGMSYDERYI